MVDNTMQCCLFTRESGENFVFAVAQGTFAVKDNGASISLSAAFGANILDVVLYSKLLTGFQKCLKVGVNLIALLKVLDYQDG